MIRFEMTTTEMIRIEMVRACQPVEQANTAGDDDEALASLIENLQQCAIKKSQAIKKS